MLGRNWLSLLPITMLLVANVQSIDKPKIDSDGKLEVGEKFETLCHFTYNFTTIKAAGTTLESNCTICNTELNPATPTDFICDRPTGRPLQEGNPSSDFIIDIPLVIENTRCDMDNIVCACTFSYFNQVNIMDRVQKTLLLSINSVKPQTPSFKPEPTTFYENVESDIVCEGNVGHPIKDLNVLTRETGAEKDITVPDLTRSDTQDQNTCSYTQTATGKITLTRKHNGGKIACEVTGGYRTEKDIKVQLYSPWLNVPHEVAQRNPRRDTPTDATIAINGLDVVEETTHVVERGKKYTIRCKSNSNPPPTYSFYYTSIDNTKEAKVQASRPAYISRLAEDSHAGRYYCTAYSKMTNGVENTATSKRFTLEVTEAKAVAGMSTTTLIVAIMVPTLLVLSAVGAGLYIRRRRSQQQETPYPEDYYYDEAYATPDTPAPRDADERRPTVTSYGKEDGVTVSITRSRSRAGDAGSTRSKNRDVDSRQSIRR